MEPQEFSTRILQGMAKLHLLRAAPALIAVVLGYLASPALCNHNVACSSVSFDGLRAGRVSSLSSAPSPLSVHRPCVLRLRGAGDEAKAEAAAEKELGNAAYKKKDFETAIKHYEKAAELDPTAIVYRNNIAAAHFGKGDFEKCLEACAKALEVGEAHRADFKDLARTYARRGNALAKLERLEEAIKEYDTSLINHKDPDVELKRRQAIRKKEDQEEAAYLDPVKAEEARQLGNSLFKEGKWVEAIKAYTDGTRRDPKNHLIYSNRAQTYIKVMDFGSALKDCDTCMELKPDFPRAYARKANVQILCKQLHKAKETVEAGLQLCPNDPELIQVKAKVQAGIMGVGLSPEERELRAQEAMKDPKIQMIMQDPVMRDVLNDMQSDPAAAQKHMMDDGIREKVETLMAAGIIQMR